MNGSRFYWFETAFCSMRDALRGFLHEQGFYYELSGVSGLWHFEIQLDAQGVAAVNDFIESQSIVEQPVSNRRCAWDNAH